MESVALSVALPLPSHDPPVAWRVHDHPIARLGFPVIAYPAMPEDRVAVNTSPRYMDPEPTILQHEPGKR